MRRHNNSMQRTALRAAADAERSAEYLLEGCMIRYFLCWVVVSGFVYSVLAASPPEQAETITAIMKLGGVVEIDEQRPGKPVVKVDLHETKVTDADLDFLKSLTELRTLDLRLTKITDDGVSRLKGLKELRSVNLFRTQLSDDGLKHLTGNKNLETLLIGGTKITDKGLAHLKSFPKLKKLSVFDTQIGDAGLTHLTGLSDLEVLLIGKSKVTDAGAKAIQKALPKLRFKESIG